MDKLSLLIEENKLKDRFESTVTTAILEVLNKETDSANIEHITNVLGKFNLIIKMLDDTLGLHRGDKEWEFYENEFHDRFINILLQELNKLYFQFGKTNFLQQYSKVYWEHIQKFILEMWKELPENKSVTEYESSFIKIFG